MNMNVIISPYWYGVCDIYIAEGVLIWIRLYNERNDLPQYSFQLTSWSYKTSITRSEINAMVVDVQFYDK